MKLKLNTFLEQPESHRDTRGRVDILVVQQAVA